MHAKAETWVVFLMTVKKTAGIKSVCEQGEWEEMERNRPGHHRLIQGGFTSEVEAERLARSTHPAA